jgi:ABC-2 type transport system ATP-binding protein
VEGLLKKRGDRPVLQAVDLELHAGSITVLLGPNGSGKTTLLRSILGLVRPDAGSIRVLDLPPYGRRAKSSTLRAARREIGFVPDVPDVPSWMSARDLFRFLRPQYPDWNDERAERVARDLGLDLDRPFAALSRGEGTRAMLAAALAPAPCLCLFDEPFSGVDPLGREALLRAFLSEARLEDGAALITTHDLEVAARIADRIVVLRDGRLEECTDRESTTASIPSGLRALLARLEADPTQPVMERV